MIYILVDLVTPRGLWEIVAAHTSRTAAVSVCSKNQTEASVSVSASVFAAGVMAYMSVWVLFVLSSMFAFFGLFQYKGETKRPWR